MSTQTLGELNAPLRTLQILSAQYPNLPAPGVSVSTIYPDLLELSFHDDFAGFEAWRDALEIAPESVTHHVQGNGRTGVLIVRTEYAGARLHLIGYATVPAPGGGRSRSEVGP
ncbi:hypothetical protein [Streptomyces formicae]|uniref:Uncharacterized protein n=1 Tax=Streptomyces formicae TaxID=1616117 RepID=A0ABY3WTR3_9ACTN|nr:hypothetical protein [Streptomyces formicae]UNM16048.1 hypothetical protein J4032_35380 [Streptomyces formicae]